MGEIVKATEQLAAAEEAMEALERNFLATPTPPELPVEENDA